MTCAALTFKMIGRFIGSMARRAIDQAGVIDIGRLPTRCGVTGAALAGIVRGRRIGSMARGTISETGVIKRCRLPT